MAISKKIILDLVEGLPEEKLGKVISYIKFVSKEEEPILLLEEDDESDILNILEDDEWYDSDNINAMIENKKDE